jgi:hypothetical protein
MQTKADTGGRLHAGGLTQDDGGSGLPRAPGSVPLPRSTLLIAPSRSGHFFRRHACRAPRQPFELQHVVCAEERDFRMAPPQFAKPFLIMHPGYSVLIPSASGRTSVLACTRATVDSFLRERNRHRRPAATIHCRVRLQHRHDRKCVWRVGSSGCRAALLASCSPSRTQTIFRRRRANRPSNFPVSTIAVGGTAAGPATFLRNGIGALHPEQMNRCMGKIVKPGGMIEIEMRQHDVTHVCRVVSKTLICRKAASRLGSQD